jgi:hypothetical protein
MKEPLDNWMRHNENVYIDSFADEPPDDYFDDDVFNSDDDDL